MLQVVGDAVFWQKVLLYCGHVTYQIWACFETFEGNVNRTNTVSFDAHWTSGTKKRRFRDFLSKTATDL